MPLESIALPLLTVTPLEVIHLHNLPSSPFWSFGTDIVYTSEFPTFLIEYVLPCLNIVLIPILEVSYVSPGGSGYTNLISLK
ncbi:hypothetical protein [Intestinibacter bartlettii]|mgnify:CR=1 FL=1|uniref:hypothetical protein n=1 Tax=Intestinibacter bartlettii TaxID=261299 RepID=UPI0022061ACF|nr:MAG: hypothetical protein [Bacteriophage sp.]